MWPVKRLKRRARLYQTLATALGAGLGPERALDLTADPRRGDGKWVVVVKRHLAANGSLSESLRQAGSVPDPEARVLIAAETAGKLPEVLAQLAKYLESRAAALRRLGLKLLYPLVLVHAAVLLPNLRWLVTGGAPAYFRRVVPVLLALYGLAAATVVVLLWCRGQVQRSPAFASWVRRLPMIGSVIHLSASSAYAYLLAKLVAAGVPIGEALAEAASCSDNAQLAVSGARITKQVVQRGEDLSSAFRREKGSWPTLLVEAVRAGEASGRLEETLLGAARGLRQEADHRTEILLTVLPFVLYLAAAAYVAWVVISTFTGLYSFL